MIIEWFVILTIGCLPPDQQPPGANCIIETKVTEAPVFDEATAKKIVGSFGSKMKNALPGSFALARYEKRAREKTKGEEK